MIIEVRNCEKNGSYYVVVMPNDYKYMSKRIKRLEIELHRLDNKRGTVQDTERTRELSRRIKRNLDDLRETRRRSRKTIPVRQEDIPETLPTRPLHDVPRNVYKPTEEEYEEIIEKLRFKAEKRREKMAVNE